LSKQTDLNIKNKKAFHEYIILDRYEAGIALKGPEIKSVRQHNVNFRDSHVRIQGNDVFLINLHIARYKNSGYSQIDPSRNRRLLLNKREIRKLSIRVIERGLTIVPLRLYFKNGLLKVEIGLAKGKKIHDKRETIKKKELVREWQRKQ